MDFIETYPGMFPDELCDQLIAGFENKKEFWSDQKLATRVDNGLNINEFQSLSKASNESKALLKKCYTLYNHAFSISINFEDVICEVFKLQKSTDGGGFYHWHHEQGRDYRTISRFAVWMVYLNDDFEGGHTDFMYQNKSIKPKKGTVVIWPAAYTHVHRGNTDLVGTKYILTGWFRYPILEDIKTFDLNQIK